MTSSTTIPAQICRHDLVLTIARVCDDELGGTRFRIKGHLVIMVDGPDGEGKDAIRVSIVVAIVNGLAISTGKDVNGTLSLPTLR
jgi:hypothetical protein